MAVDERLTLTQFLSVLATIVAFVLSMWFSFKSFNGYVVFEEVDVVSNWYAVILFFLGILGTYLIVWRKKWGRKSR